MPPKREDHPGAKSDLSALRDREAQIRLILDGVRDHAISMLDREGRIVTWNAAAEELKGYALAEVEGQHFRMLFTDADRQAGLPESELEIARTKGKFLGEGYRLRKDGTQFYASVSVSALHGDDGVLRGFVKVTHDITDEIRLRARIARLHQLTSAFAEAATSADVVRVLVEDGTNTVEASTSALWLVEEDGSLRLAAHRGVPDAFIDPWRAISRDADVPAARVARSREPIWVQSRTEYHAATGAIAEQAEAAGRLNAFAALPLLVRERLVGVLVYSHDGAHEFPIEEKAVLETIARDCAQALDRARLLDAELRANERLRILTDASALFSSSLDYETTFANLAQSLVPRLADWCAVDLLEPDGVPRAVAIAHVDPDKAAYGYELRRAYPPRPADRGLMNVLKTGQSELYPLITDEMLSASALDDHELRMIRDLGLRSVIIVPLTVRGRTFGAITLVSTADDRRYSDDDLQLAREIASRASLAVDSARLYRESQEVGRRASEASRLKDEFLATVSHELRTPLNALLGWSRLLRSGELSPEKRVKALESIERNAVAQAQLVDDLLDISRIITGKLRLEVRALELARVVEAAVESVRPAMEAKEIRLELILDPDTHAIMGDATRLQQVVWNLLSNAVKFTPKGGRVQVVLHRINSHVELSVVDSGQGIATEFLPYVFDRFRQADASRSRAHGGLGLGLAICRSLVELHGGTIELYSEGTGKGTTARIKLPRSPVVYQPRDAAQVHPTAPEDPTFVSPPELRGLKILVVDDEADARELLVTILERCGAIARAARSMSEALEVVQEWRPEVLLSDIGMPGGDGYELIEAVRKLPAERGGNTPAAALTAYARAEDRRKALIAGYHMHVPKPVEPSELAAVIANLARIGRALR